MQKVFSILYNNHPDYLACIESRVIPDWIEHRVVTERVLTKDMATSIKGFQYDTDIERLYHLQKDPSQWYIDADTKVIKWPDFKMEPGYPYISPLLDAKNTYNLKRYDDWCILGNDCQKFFDDAMDVFQSYKGKPPQWWFHQLLDTEWFERVKPLPDGYFKHMHYGRYGVQRANAL